MMLKYTLAVFLVVGTLFEPVAYALNILDICAYDGTLEHVENNPIQLSDIVMSCISSGTCYGAFTRCYETSVCGTAAQELLVQVSSLDSLCDGFNSTCVYDIAMYNVNSEEQPLFAEAIRCVTDCVDHTSPEVETTTETDISNPLLGSLTQCARDDTCNAVVDACLESNVCAQTMSYVLTNLEELVQHCTGLECVQDALGSAVSQLEPPDLQHFMALAQCVLVCASNTMSGSTMSLSRSGHIETVVPDIITEDAFYQCLPPFRCLDQLRTCNIIPMCAHLTLEAHESIPQMAALCTDIECVHESVMEMLESHADIGDYPRNMFLTALSCVQSCIEDNAAVEAAESADSGEHEHQTRVLARGILTDDGGILNYRDNLECPFNLIVPVGTKVELKFTEFDMERSFDKLSLYFDDGDDSEMTLIAVYSGESVPRDMNITNHHESKDAYLTLEMYTDRSVTRSGFRMSWLLVCNSHNSYYHVGAQECRPLTRCGADEVELVPPSVHGDRVCVLASDTSFRICDIAGGIIEHPQGTLLDSPFESAVCTVTVKTHARVIFSVQQTDLLLTVTGTDVGIVTISGSRGWSGSDSVLSTVTGASITADNRGEEKTFEITWQTIERCSFGMAWEEDECKTIMEDKLDLTTCDELASSHARHVRGAASGAMCDATLQAPPGFVMYARVVYGFVTFRDMTTGRSDHLRTNQTFVSSSNRLKVEFRGGTVEFVKFDPAWCSSDMLFDVETYRCRPIRTCNEFEIESVPPTLTSDRACKLQMFFSEARNVLATHAGASSIAVGDVTGDGIPDIVVGSYDDYSVYYFVLLHNDTFEERLVYDKAYGVLDVWIGDVFGNNDIVVALSLTNSILLFENEGQGVFRSPITITDTLTTVMSITSFNGHVFGVSPADSNIVMFRYDNAVFSGTSITRAVNSPRHISEADIDGDGDADLLVASHGDNSVIWLENNGSGNDRFLGGQPHRISSLTDDPRSVASGDLDLDGSIDVVIVSYNDDTVTAAYNNGNGIFSLKHVAVANEAVDVALADVNGDHFLDIVIVAAAADSVVWYENHGITPRGDTTSWTTHTIDTGINDPWGVIAADLDNDDDIDVAVVSIASGDVVVYMNTRNVHHAAHVDCPQNTVYVSGDKETLESTDFGSMNPHHVDSSLPESLDLSPLMFETKDGLAHSIPRDERVTLIQQEYNTRAVASCVIEIGDLGVEAPNDQVTSESTDYNHDQSHMLTTIGIAGFVLIGGAILCWGYSKIYAPAPVPAPAPAPAPAHAEFRV